MARQWKKNDLFAKQLATAKKSVLKEERSISRTAVVDKKMDKMIADEDEIQTTCMQILKGKPEASFTPKDLMARMLRSKVKDNIFREEV